MNRHILLQAVVSILTLTPLLGFPAPTQAQANDAPQPSGGSKWILVDALGYGGRGFGLGLLASQTVEGVEGPRAEVVAPSFPPPSFHPSPEV